MLHKGRLYVYLNFIQNRSFYVPMKSELIRVSNCIFLSNVQKSTIFASISWIWCDTHMHTCIFTYTKCGNSANTLLSFYTEHNGIRWKVTFTGLLSFDRRYKPFLVIHYQRSSIKLLIPATFARISWILQKGMNN